MDFADRITRLPIPADRDRGQSAFEATGIADPRLGDLIRGAPGCSLCLASLIQREVDDRIADLFVSGSLTDGGAVTVDAVDGALAVRSAGALATAA